MERCQYGLRQCRLSGCHGGVRAVARRRVRERSALPESRQRLFQAGYERAGHTQLPEGAQARSGRRGYPLQPVDRRSPHAGSYRVGSRLFRQAVDRVARTFRREQHVGRAEPRVFRADAFLHGRVPVVEACFVPESRILRSARLAVAFRRFGRVRVGRAQGPPASRRGGRHELGRAGQKLARRLEHRYFRAA